MTSLTITILIGLLLLGGWMVSRGRRGRRIDDHPVCAKCKFDLTGRPETSRECPECGVALDGYHAIETGNRLPRLGLIYAGAMIVLLAAIPLVTSMGLSIFKIDPIRLEPLSWLLRGLDKDRWDIQPKDFAEIVSRVKSGRLSSDDIEKVVKVALRDQADLSKTWNPQWGDLIEYLNSKGQLSAADWKTYLAQDEPVTLEVRPNVARGDPIPFHLFGQLRGATPLAPRSSFAAVTATVPGAVFSQMAMGGGTEGSWFDLTENLEMKPAAWNQLKPGPQMLLVIFTSMASIAGLNPILFPPINCQGNWTLLPDGQQSSHLYRDEAMAAEVQKTLYCEVEMGPVNWQSFQLEIKAKQPPIDLAFEVAIRFAGKEWPAADSYVYIDAHSTNGANKFGSADFLLDPKFIGQHVDVILRPSLQMAAYSVHMDKVLDHDFVVKDVLIADKP